jgi:hypothetical protein
MKHLQEPSSFKLSSKGRKQIAKALESTSSACPKLKEAVSRINKRNGFYLNKI